MKTEYDSIAEQYAKTLSSARRRFIYEYSLFKNIGDVSGLDVIDFACGEGAISRQLKLKGARRVVGIDISREQIKRAKLQERQKTLGICYVCSAGERLDLKARFDLAVCSYYFQYASNLKMLEAMVNGVCKNLRKGGRMVSLNGNPFFPVLKRGDGSSIREWVGKPFKDGSRIKVTLVDESGAPLCTVYNYYYSVQTYNRILNKAGFGQIKWHLPEISKDGIRKLGREYWKFYKTKPSLLVLTAVKKGIG